MIFPSLVSWGVFSVREIVKRHPLYIKFTFLPFVCLSFSLKKYLFYLFLYIYFFQSLTGRPLHKLCGNLYFKLVYYSLPQNVLLGPQVRKCRTLLGRARSKFKQQPMVVSTTMIAAIVKKKYSEPSARSNRITDHTRIK